MKFSTLKIFKSIFLLFIIKSFLSTASAQHQDFWSQVRYGGGISLGFNNGGFNIILAPSAMYSLTTKWSVGTGVNLGYINSKNYESFVYGISAITLFNPIPQVQLSLELEETGVSRTIKIDNFQNQKDSYWYPAIFIGAGYRIGRVSVGLRYDVLYDSQKSIYGSPYMPFARYYF